MTREYRKLSDTITTSIDALERAVLAWFMRGRAIWTGARWPSNLYVFLMFIHCYLKHQTTPNRNRENRRPRSWGMNSDITRSWPDCVHNSLSLSLSLSLIIIIINTLHTLDGIPNAYYYGQEGPFNCLVIDLLGPSLEDLFERCGRKFSTSTICRLAVQLV